MKILGIDPGIARTGWGIIEKKESNWSSQQYDCITTEKHLNAEERLKVLYEQLRKVIFKYKPQEAAVEKLFFNTNAKTAMQVGHARGVTLLAITNEKIPITHYTPLQVKIAITGYGRAEKIQVQKMIKTLLNLESIPKPDDTADALAVALTHAYSRKSNKL